MKKALALMGIIVGLCLLVGTVEAADKFGYVNIERILDEYNKAKDYDKALTAKKDTYKAELDKKVNELKQLQDKYELMGEKEKQAKRPELEAKVKSAQEYDQQKGEDLRKEQLEKMNELFKDIEAAVKQYAEKEGYTMIFNDRVLVYQSKSMDISGKITEILNKSYKGK